MKPRIVKLRSGFLATTVPGSALLDRDGVPLGADDEFSRIPSAEEAEKPLAELFSHVPQEPWSDLHVPCGDLGCGKCHPRRREAAE